MKLLLSLFVVLFSSLTFASATCDNGVSNRLANSGNEKIQKHLGTQYASVNTPDCTSQWIRNYFSDYVVDDNLNLTVGCGVEIEFPTEDAMKTFFENYFYVNNGMDELTVFDLFADMAVPFCGTVKK